MLLSSLYQERTLYYSIHAKNIQPMILEVAILDVKPSRVNEFETAFKTASTIISLHARVHLS